MQDKLVEDEVIELIHVSEPVLYLPGFASSSARDVEKAKVYAYRRVACDPPPPPPPPPPRPPPAQPTVYSLHKGEQATLLDYAQSLSRGNRVDVKAPPYSPVRP